MTVLAFAVDSELCSDEMEQMYSVFRLVVDSHEEESKHNDKNIGRIFITKYMCQITCKVVASLLTVAAEGVQGETTAWHGC